ncbi:serpin family protein [Maledivibacter halophilus]|uniref:Serpin B n=1 Tax=Maledivibacter halophilus TaxID=36842 RepID=A0A1T5KYM4_9FIRM|nr:serpin family protein [Maledivibacter halophilus]SKC68743.1 serpin B [Maledivibacter halophilus]
MKKYLFVFISICIVVVILVSCSKKDSYEFNIDTIDSKVTDGNLDFAFNLFKELYKEQEQKENIVISPMSISTALSMTYNGAKGTTREGMDKTLSYNGIKKDALNESYKNLLNYFQSTEGVELNIANSIWIREGVTVKDDFITTNRDNYFAKIENLDFSQEDATNIINNWISQSTKGKINKMLESPISNNVMMYLINAVYFKGQWYDKFDKNRTYEDVFYNNSNNTSKVLMMSKTSDIQYASTGNYKAIKLPYKDTSKSMYLLLPNENVTMDEFINNLNKDTWHEMKESLQETKDVYVKIPRFKVEYGIKDLKNVLRQLGMEEAFSESADFSGIKEGIFINKVLHKAVIEVNEEGSEASGVTVVEMTESAQIEPDEFIANRPFIYAIEDDKTYTLLFMGVMSHM